MLFFMKCWTIKSVWHIDERRSVHRPAVIYEHVVHRCYVRFFFPLLLEIWITFSLLLSSVQTCVWCFIRCLSRVNGWLIIVDDRYLVSISCGVKDKYDGNSRTYVWQLNLFKTLLGLPWFMGMSPLTLDRENLLNFSYCNHHFFSDIKGKIS